MRCKAVDGRMAPLAIVVLLSACSKSSARPDEAPKQAAPVASAPAAAAPSIAAAQPVAPAMETLTLAIFKDTELLECSEMQATPDKIAAFVVPEGTTRLSQPCDSLGRIALTTCTRANAVERYYHFAYSEKFMNLCTKNGGQWQTNHTPEAEAERSQQQAAFLQKGGN